MLQKIFSRKEYVLAGGTVLLFLLSYQFAFKKTIDLWQDNTRLKARLVPAGDLSVQPEYLKRKSENLTAILRTYRVDSAAFRNSVINTVARIAARENVRLLEVPSEDPYFRTSKFTVQKLVFQGDYFSLVKTLKNLQQEADIGAIRSAALKLPGRGQTGDLRSPVLELYFLSAK
jgi:hypothetical protein